MSTQRERRRKRRPGAGEPAGGQRGGDAHEERRSGRLEMQAALEKAGARRPPRRPRCLRMGGLPPTPAFRPPARPPNPFTRRRERRERDSNHPGLRAVAAAPVRPQRRDPVRRRLPTDRQVVRRRRRRRRRRTPRARALPRDVPRPSNPEDGRPRGVGRVGGRPGAGHSKLGRCYPPPKTRESKETQRTDPDPSRTDPSAASTAAPLRGGARGNYASYGATEPFGGFSEGRAPVSDEGPEVRQTKSPPQAAANRAMRVREWSSRRGRRGEGEGDRRREGCASTPPRRRRKPPPPPRTKRQRRSLTPS